MRSTLIQLMNSISIGKKISIGFFLILLLLLTQYAFIFRSFDRVDAYFDDQSTLNENTTTIIKLSRDISDLQRLALSYGMTGSHSIMTNLKEHYGKIIYRLEEVKDYVKDESSLSLIEDMHKVMKRYGENLNVLEQRYKFRDDILNRKIPAAFEEGREYLEKLENKYHRFEGPLLIWLMIKINTLKFFQRRGFSLRKEVLDDLERLSHWNIKDPKLKEEFRGFEKIRKSYLAAFKQGVQANRIYLSLVKVVMAGEQAEFARLSDQLRERTFERSSSFLVTHDYLLDKTQKNAEHVLLLSIPLVLLLILFYIQNISQALRALTKVFDEFIEGRLDAEIPGLERKDEIGILAKAADRFKELNLKYREAKKLAEDNAHAKSVFLADMSHEIRTPMNGVLGMVSLLKDTELSDSQREMLESISTSGDSLSTILNDILDLSKVEFGKMKLEYVPFNFKRAMTDLNVLFSKLSVEKGLIFECHLADNIPEWISGDITRLRQVLMNLLNNSLKFTSKGFVRLSINSTLDIDGRANLEFIVEDSGEGISEEEQKGVFNAFSQGDSSTTRKFGGTGLGLAIAKNIVELMGGKITLESKKGIGSKFSFTVVFNVVENPKKDSVQESSQNIMNLTKGHKVLVVEDNEINIKVAKGKLERYGFKVDIACNGQEAVDISEVHKYDIIFMDMQMPVLDGLEATKIIRRGEKNDRTPIVAMTANVMAEDRERCFSVGMDYFLSKPFHREQLEEIIHTIFVKAA